MPCGGAFTAPGTVSCHSEPTTNKGRTRAFASHNLAFSGKVAAGDSRQSWTPAQAALPGPLSPVRARHVSPSFLKLLKFMEKWWNYREWGGNSYGVQGTPQHSSWEGIHKLISNEYTGGIWISPGCRSCRSGAPGYVHLQVREAPSVPAASPSRKAQTAGTSALLELERTGTKGSSPGARSVRRGGH